MSRLLLQSISNTAPIPLGAPPPAGISKSGMIYTFAFIGASTLVGMCFLMVVFKYVVSYRHWRPPNTTPLQPAGRQEDYKPEHPHIKEIVVVSNPDGCPSISIIREDKMSDEKPPFVTYETMISSKALNNYSQKYMQHACAPTAMKHAASASDLAGMGTPASLLAKESPSTIQEEGDIV